MELEANDDVVQCTGFILSPIFAANLIDEEAKNLAQMNLVDTLGIFQIAPYDFMRTGGHLQPVLMPRIEETSGPLHFSLCGISECLCT